MNRWAIFGIAALSISLFAEEEVAVFCHPEKKSEEPAQTQQPMPPVSMELPSARPMSDHGWYVFVDGLYWHADVGNTEWAWKVDELDEDIHSGDVHSVPFKWDWGFRLGVGLNLSRDGWDTNLFYTWFHTENSNTAGVGPSGIVTNLLASNNLVSTFTTGNAHWSIHFSMFDWELARWYAISKNFSVRPHAGIKGGWINQDVDYNLENAQSQLLIRTGVYRFKNDFWGVGPAGGASLMWTLGRMGMNNQHQFMFFGDFAGALMYGHFQVHHKELYFIDGTLTEGSIHPTNLNCNLVAPMLQTILGLGWEVAFNENKNNFIFKVGYELQYWFRQYQQLVGFSDSGEGQNAHRLSSDLALQGLTIDFRFDF